MTTKDSTITISVDETSKLASYCCQIFFDRESKKGIKNITVAAKKLEEISFYYAFLFAVMFNDERRKKIVEEYDRKEAEEAVIKKMGDELPNLVKDLFGDIL